MNFNEALLLAKETSPEAIANFISVKYKNGFYENKNVNNVLSNIEKEIKVNKNSFDINGKKIVMNKNNFLKYINDIKNNLKLKDEETKIKVHNQLNKFQENVLKFL